jgi:uncharacterized repeat protein (TIGR01451 family)
MTTVYAAESVNVTIVEDGRITSYFNQYWVVNVDGTITVTNPTNRDLYDIELRYDILSLSLIETSGTSYFEGGRIIIPRIPGNSSVTATYNIVGITLQDPTLLNKGVLYTAITKYFPVIYTDTFGQLQKASLEDPTLTGRNGRLVSVALRNPSGFQFTVNSLKVLKTPSLDPNTVLDEWRLVNATNPITIDPDTLYVRDILDQNSAEGQVYWLVADLFISRVDFYDISNVTRYSEENLTIPPELLNYTFNETNRTNRTYPFVTEVYAKKLSDTQLVTAGEPVQLSIIINNFAAKLFNITINDELPPGFQFVGGSGWQEIDGKPVYRGVLSGKNALVATYTVMLNDTDSAGLDYFAEAAVTYTADKVSNTIYSDTVPFIRQFIPDSKIYVQKKLRFEDDDQVVVTISVQNLGGGPVQDLLLREYLDDSDVFSQISEIPSEKGLWAINELKDGELWEVSYTTTRDTQYSILPGLYGVPSGSVLKSLILENVIETAWEVVRTATLEIVGILLLIGLPVLYFVLKRKHIQ